jgi:UDP-glucose 4-epimerase
MEKIAITGASGFIGNSVVDYLSKKGYDILAFGKQDKRIIERPNIKWKFLDLNDLSKEDLEDSAILIHFAGAYTAQDAFSKNVSMLKHVLNESNKSNIKKFYLISTYAVFGNRTSPADITAPYDPLEAYAMSKVMAEEEFKRFLKTSKFIGSIIRPPSLYGPNGKNFVDVIIEKIRKKEEIQMVHFKNQFLHTQDFVKILEEIIKENPQKPIYNIEGEIITEGVLKEIFKELNINFTLNEMTARSYWCSGLKAKDPIKVKDYIKKEKEKIENAI